MKPRGRNWLLILALIGVGAGLESVETHLHDQTFDVHAIGTGALAAAVGAIVNTLKKEGE